MEPIQIAFVIVIGVVLLGVLSVVTKKASGLDQSYYKKRWSHINKTLKDGESGKKLAIIDADKLLDHALRARGFKGSDMGGRLRSAETTLASCYQSCWDAHKLRNRLVHEEVKLRGTDVRTAINAYTKALKKLGAI